MAKSKDKPDQDDENVQPQPGAVITPGAAQSASPESTEAPVSATAVSLADTAQQSEEKPLTSSVEPSQVSRDEQSVIWTASEFVAHEKSAGWYLSLAGAGLLLAILIFLVTRDVVSVGVVVVAVLVLGVYAARQPRQLEYKINQKGLSIGGKYHSYDELRSFSILPEGAFSSIVFMPLKRFSPALTIYYAPEDEEKIMAILSNQLPFEEPRRDTIDSLMRHIRF